MKRLLITAAAMLVLLLNWSLSHYQFIDGKFYCRDLTVMVMPEEIEPSLLAAFPHLRWLDLRGRGMTPAEYEEASRAVPDCRILWDVAFQGGAVNADVRELTIEHLEEDDLPLLDVLHRLRRIDATNCRDYPQLLELTARHPEWCIDYCVELGGCWSCHDRCIEPGKCTRQQVQKALPLLPEVRKVDLRGTGLEPAEAASLADEFPHIRFLWEMELGGASFLSSAQELDLSGIPMENTETVEALLPYLPEVRKIIMCDCGIPSPEMAELGQRHPEIRFVWRVKLGPLSARTDDKWFAPITHHQLIGGHDVDELQYCTDMECIDLGHCWIRSCEWARGMKNLRYLVLADSYVRDLSPLSDLKKLTYLELFVTPVTDYSPLLGCTGLEDLNLGYTRGDPRPIAQMHWLKNLWWGGIGNVPWADGRSPAALLRESLPDTCVTLYSGSSTGFGWRKLPHYYEMRDRIGMYYMNG